MGKLTDIFIAALLAVSAVSASGEEAVVEPSPEIGPSRYAGENIDEYIKSLTVSFSSANRVTDPFGQFQDPETKPAVKRPVISPAGPAEPPVAFSEIIGMIKITAVMTAEKRFLVGSRSIAQGDHFPIPFRGRQIRVEVTEVSARQVEFKNIETGELASQILNVLPAGMTSGGGVTAAPGMTPAGADAPLEIEIDGGASAPSPAR